MTALDTDTPTPPMQSGSDPLAIPGRKRPTDVPADTSIGPPALARAPSPASMGGRPTVRFNPTGTDLVQAGVLRPESGPWSASNPQPLVGPDGRLVSAPVLTATNAAIPRRPTPAVVTASASSPSATTPPRPVPGAPALDSATSLSGRLLGYGRDVKGVRTFDNSDVPALNTAAARINLADAGIGGNVGSEANGGTLNLSPGAITPTSMPVRPTNIFTDPAAAANANARLNASSDAASIANRDPRSVLGSAARNAEVEANSIGGVKGATILAEALKNLNAIPTSEVANTAKLGEAGLAEEGLASRAQLQSDTDLAREAIAKRPEPKEITLEDGTLGILGPDGRVRPAIGASGQPARPQLSLKNTDPAGYSKSLQDNLRLTLGLDPNTGLMPDPDDPKKQRAPTPRELLLASRAAKALTDEQFGMGDARTSAASPPNDIPNEKSLEALRKNAGDPQTRSLFDKRYGAGAAARYLGR